MSCQDSRACALVCNSGWASPPPEVGVVFVGVLVQDARIMMQAKIMLRHMVTPFVTSVRDALFRFSFFILGLGLVSHLT